MSYPEQRFLPHQMALGNWQGIDPKQRKLEMVLKVEGKKTLKIAKFPYSTSFKKQD